MRRRVCLLVCAAAACAARADVVTLEGVPSYLWYHGCGPTAGGMVIGTWDGRGYVNLIDGSNDWNTNPQAVKDMIASPGHIEDYQGTPDCSETPDLCHDDDCVADFMCASRSSYGLGDGQSYPGFQGYGMTQYARYCGYVEATSGRVDYADDLWGLLVSEIDAGRPVELYVDTDKNGSADHFVTALGYDTGGGGSPARYACYNTYDHAAHWHEFAAAAVGQAWGLRSGFWFDPGPMPGDADRDGDVDAFDVQQILASNAYESGEGWGWDCGDFNGDTAVDWADIQMILDHLPSGSPLEGILLPEPGTMALLAVGAWMVLVGRKRRPRRRAPARAGLTRATGP